MFCPKCGNQVPDDANFCMSCGTDLSQYHQQSFEGGAITGDVGRIQNSVLKRTVSQQQASTEQNPITNIHINSNFNHMRELLSPKRYLIRQNRISRELQFMSEWHGRIAPWLGQTASLIDPSVIDHGQT